MRNDTTRAVGYIRVSQERAARNGYGLQAQESAIRKHTEYKDWKLQEIYSERGVSGYKRDRPELNRLLEGARTGKFDVVVFPSIDRVGRSVKDVIEIDSFLQKQNIDTVFLREGIDTSTPTGALYRNIMSSVAEFEGKLIYERLSKGKRAKASNGGYVGGWLPYGYRLDDGNIVVIKEEAEVVEKIFKWRAKGMTYKWICGILNTSNVKTQKNSLWYSSTIRGILKNRFYTGRALFEGTFIRAPHDAIVSDVLFRKINSQKKT